MARRKNRRRIGKKQTRQAGRSGERKFSGMEALEQRQLLTVSPSLSGGTLTIGGISDDGSRVVISGADDLVLNGERHTNILVSDIQTIVVDGGSGNDVIDLRGIDASSFTNLSETLINGRGGNDMIFGSFAEDEIRGGVGRDFVNGFGGNDSIFGGDGEDFLFGGDGEDTIAGGGSDDNVYGESGVDTLYGDWGMSGETAEDITGDSGHDVIVGGAGDIVKCCVLRISRRRFPAVLR